MTKLYRVEAYVLDLNGDCPTKESVVENIEHNRHPEFISVEDVQEADCGEFDDDHQLNKSNPDYKKYFPLTYPGPNDEKLKIAFQDLTEAYFKQSDRLRQIEFEARCLRKEIEKLKKVQEFVKTIGELI